MRAWFQRVWTDEEAFKVLVRNVVKFAITSAGFWTPLLVNSKIGWIAGPFIASLGVSIPSRPMAPKA